jgi:hypothetical protein
LVFEPELPCGACAGDEKREVIPMSDDAQFSCTACHIHSDKDVMTACRLCGRLHCSDCVDEHGRCVECSSEEKGQDR